MKKFNSKLKLLCGLNGHLFIANSMTRVVDLRASKKWRTAKC